MLIMLKEARRFRAIDYSETCDVQAISICTTDWYKQLKAQYRYAITDTEETLPESPPLPNHNAISAESREAKQTLMSMCRSLKGGAY